MPTTGIIATNNLQHLLDLQADCLLYFATTVGRDEETTADILPFLERGVNVVSIAHFDLQYPKFGRPEMVRPVEEACRRGGSSVILTGCEPGYSFGQLLFALLTGAGRVDHIEVTEACDVQFSTGRGSLEMYGMTRELDFLPPLFTSQLGAKWHIDTLRGIADYMDVEIDDVEQSWQTAAADVAFETAAFGDVAAGKTAGTRWTVHAMAGGKPFITYNKILLLHPAAGEGWDIPRMAKHAAVHKIVVTGDPSFENTEFKGCAPSYTSLHPVNLAPFICDAPPGILTQHDIRPVPPTNVPARRKSPRLAG
jgi:4-hydroxy-tetrahydrodipicolinate reductase